MCASRYVIGIDLGTSNSALAYHDSLAPSDAPATKILETRQHQLNGDEVYLTTLPSNYFFPFADEPPERVGLFARLQSEFVPGRVIESAKSWLVHSGVDRNEGFLPWASDEIALKDRLSPVDVSSRYLRFFADEWNRTIGANDPDYAFERQELVITVPASFDDVAQRLTLEAARRAGLSGEVRLLEEPQAAFYHWLDTHNGELLQSGSSHSNHVQTLLVCDIGGGTTDFSLFEVTPERGDGLHAQIRRIAVSDHLLLGGDNIDLTLAHRLQAEFQALGHTLKQSQWRHLLVQSRLLKERVLGDENQDLDQDFRVSVPGSGQSLFANTVSASIRRRDLLDLILEGFFPLCRADDRPQRRSGGLKEAGLPFAEDSAVTKHLAAFVQRRSVDAVLFNGGTLQPPVLTHRILDVLASWQGGVRPRQLFNSNLNLAVAHGAAYYASLLRQAKRPIRADYARSLFLEVQAGAEDAGRQLICIVPQGVGAGASFVLDSRFVALLNRPVRFQLFSSTHTPEAKLGDVITLDTEKHLSLPPMQTVLRAGELGTQADELEIKLKVHLTELGMLQLEVIPAVAEDTNVCWPLEFNLRTNVEKFVEAPKTSFADKKLAPSASGLEQNVPFADAIALIDKHYGRKRSDEQDTNPKQLVKNLETLLRSNRNSWPIDTLRGLWPALRDGMNRRNRSLAHETSWLSLAGFVLRPGYGAEGDAERVQDLWRVFTSGLSFPKESNSRIQWWIMWRRVAAGLLPAQHEELLTRALPLIAKKPPELAELLRLVSSLEYASPTRKAEVGNILLRLVSGRPTPTNEQAAIALARLAARVPLHADKNQVVPPRLVVEWYQKLTKLMWDDKARPAFIQFVAVALRYTADVARDLPLEIREEAAAKLRTMKAPPDQISLLINYHEPDSSYLSQLFGEEMPSGLRLAGDL
ncbi:MAG: Hsp70 family protein [Bdellovibrionota bacterium]